ncbi:hypothetical protein GF325_06730 [Candidatus Bathyarchaeota archaeon]|nr:hypothetical protein [Candidatus Bathyarchaeota archaeon]
MLKRIKSYLLPVKTFLLLGAVTGILTSIPSMHNQGGAISGDIGSDTMVGKGRIFTPIISYSPHEPIEIIGNSELDAFCSGNGTSGNSSHPHVISDYIINCNNASEGIVLQDITLHLRVENCRVLNASGNLDFSTNLYDAGIKILNCTNIHVQNTTIDANYCGMGIYDSTNVTILGNLFHGNSFMGIIMNESKVTMKNNSFEGCGVFLSAAVETCASQDIDQSNTMNGDACIYYLSGLNDEDLVLVPGSQLILVNSTNIRISDHATSNGSVGMQVLYCKNVTISNHTSSSDIVYGTFVARSEDVTITNSCFSNSFYASVSYQSNGTCITNVQYINNIWDGAVLVESANATLEDITACNNSKYGIKIRDSPGCVVEGAEVSGSHIGIGVDLESNGTTVMENRVSASDIGIHLSYTGGLNITRNTLEMNDVGIHVYQMQDSIIYLNNIINSSTNQGKEFVFNNTWSNNGWGNYWSDYLDKNPTASNDGDTWNMSYLLDGETGNADENPIVEPNRIPDATFTCNLTQPRVGMKIAFMLENQDLDLPAIISWTIDGELVFNDEPSLIHEFHEPGIHTIEVYIRDKHGEVDRSFVRVNVLGKNRNEIGLGFHAFIFIAPIVAIFGVILYVRHDKKRTNWS